MVGRPYPEVAKPAPKVRANLMMNYEQQWTGDALVLIPCFPLRCS
jgi:hypothetical protein